jgi:glycine/D-amino acid oxidase-like deaminating enzyme
MEERVPPAMEGRVRVVKRSEHQAPDSPSATSWWLDEALRSEHNAPQTPPLAEEKHCDVAIVGGGFTGLWTALALKSRQPSLSVVLIEASICGAGASGMNGGKVHGYWSALPSMAKTIGDDPALSVARAGTRAQDAIRTFAKAPGRDVWWRESGNLRVSAAAAQDRKIGEYVHQARRLGVPDTAVPLTPAAVRARANSPVFRGGIFFPEGANVQPARLARELRAAAIEAGVDIHEHTRMTGLDRGTPSRVRTEKGAVIAREVVLATNVALAAEPTIRRHMSIFSSYALMTQAAPGAVEAMNWNGDEGIADLRMFVHYFRKTPDGRVLMGSGSGPIAYGGAIGTPSLRQDRQSVGRAKRGLRRLLPAFGSVSVEKSWGGPIDVSSDRLPFIRTLPGARVHFACGFSGHGVNPTYIAGQCLASLVLDARDEWSTLPLCTRVVPSLPSEPFRYIGARAIRWGIISVEEAEEAGQKPPPTASAIASLPRLLRLRIGTR